MRIFVFGLILANILLITVRMLEPEKPEHASPSEAVNYESSLPSIELAEVAQIPESQPDPEPFGNLAEPETLPDMALAGPEEADAEGVETDFEATVGNSDIANESMACIEVGPFESIEAYTDLRAELEQLFDRVETRESLSIVDAGFWVYLPSYPSREEAVAATQQLTAAGAQDFYIMPGGEMQNAISLGLYDRLESAERRRQQLNDLGLAMDFMVEPQTEVQTRYWLEAGPVNLLNPTLIELSNNNPDTQQTQVECSFAGS